MPLPLPNRYSLEVRIGNDEDVEEWLATDADLDRPVLIRMLGPESSPERRAEFLGAVRGAAAITHPNMAQVFSAEEIAEGVYSISEWPGGIRLSDRTAADLTLDPEAAVANTEGLARALSALHHSGQTHGALDSSAVFYGPDRPAKLAAIGRRSRNLGTQADVQSLARTIDQALTGRSPGSVPPSEVIDGLSPGFDAAIAEALEGNSSADQFAEALASVPSARLLKQGDPPVVTPWVRLVLGLLALAVALILIGSSLGSDPPSVPDAAQDTSPSVDAPIVDPPNNTVGASATTTPPAGSIVSITPLDPLGDGNEHHELADNLHDGDSSTTWRTELYRDPLPLIKGGIGLVVETSGTASELTIASASIGTKFQLYWAQQSSTSLTDWSLISSESIESTDDVTLLPQRTGGYWLIWLTDLPAVGEDFATEIAEIELR